MGGGLSNPKPKEDMYPTTIKEDEESNVIKPTFGAAKYYYVDPRAKGTPGPKPQQLQDALERLGFLPQDTTPSF